MFHHTPFEVAVGLLLQENKVALSKFRHKKMPSRVGDTAFNARLTPLLNGFASRGLSRGATLAQLKY
jgi:hypothetical protein